MRGILQWVGLMLAVVAVLVFTCAVFGLAIGSCVRVARLVAL